MTGDAKPKLPWKNDHGRMRELERAVRGMPEINHGAKAFLAVICQGINAKTGRFSCSDEVMEERVGVKGRTSLYRYRVALHAAGIIDFEPGRPGRPDSAGLKTSYQIVMTDDEIVAALADLKRREHDGEKRAAGDRGRRDAVGEKRLEKSRKPVEVGPGEATIDDAMFRDCNTTAFQSRNTYLPEPLPVPYSEKKESYDRQEEFLFEAEKEGEHLNGVATLRSRVEDGISGGSGLKEAKEDSREPGAAAEPRSGCMSEEEAEAMLDREIAELTRDPDFRRIVGEGSEELCERRIGLLSRYYLSGMASHVEVWPDDRIATFEHVLEVAIEVEAEANAKASDVARRKAGGSGDG
jgi:hypothetical protein